VAKACKAVKEEMKEGSGKEYPMNIELWKK
jgi:hypothetical protein